MKQNIFKLPPRFIDMDTLPEDSEKIDRHLIPSPTAGGGGVFSEAHI